MMATEERSKQALASAIEAFNVQPSVPSNQAIISALFACNLQPSSTALVVRDPACVKSTTDSLTSDAPTLATIDNVLHAYPVTNVNLYRIIKR